MPKRRMLKARWIPHDSHVMAFNPVNPVAQCGCVVFVKDTSHVDSNVESALVYMKTLEDNVTRRFA